MSLLVCALGFPNLRVIWRHFYRLGILLYSCRREARALRHVARLHRTPSCKRLLDRLINKPSAHISCLRTKSHDLIAPSSANLSTFPQQNACVLPPIYTELPDLRKRLTFPIPYCATWPHPSKFKPFLTIFRSSQMTPLIRGEVLLQLPL